MTDYTLLCLQLDSLISEVCHPISNLSNAAALLWESLDRLNWAGFYLRKDDILILGPFQGKTACIEIPLGRGVCGTAAMRKESVLVPDVHLFPGHIACDGASESELVVPLFRRDEVIGVLDLDSPEKNRFAEEDRAGLEQFARVLEQTMPDGFDGNLL